MSLIALNACTQEHDVDQTENKNKLELTDSEIEESRSFVNVDDDLAENEEDGEEAAEFFIDSELPDDPPDIHKPSSVNTSPSP